MSEPRNPWEQQKSIGEIADQAIQAFKDRLHEIAMTEPRPLGSNADEWHRFLSEYLDNRVNHPDGMAYVAMQIAYALDKARASHAELLAAAALLIRDFHTQWDDPTFFPGFVALQAAIARAEESA